MSLKHLEVDINRCNTASKIIEKVGLYIDQNEEVSTDVLLFMMLKVVPKVIKATEFSAEFGSVFELACLKASAFDFLVVF